jgi:probable rRNA maturation factor
VSIEVLDEVGSGLDARALTRISRFVMDRLRVHPQAELCIKLVDEPTLAQLNEQWMEKTGATDVLAFPMDELRPGLVNEEPEEGVLGDLVICPAVAERQAGEARSRGHAAHSTADEVDLLAVHGILHLLGYDHAEPDEHAEMFGLQARLLAEWQAVRSGGTVER